MKAGKVTQTVYRRSILKQLHIEKESALLVPSQEESCYGTRIEGDQQTLASSVSLYGNEKDLCVFAMAKAANDLAAKGAKVKGFSIQILLPEFAYESRLKTMIALAEEVAQQEDLPILAANAQSVPAIQTTIVHVTAIGVVKEDAVMQCYKVKPGQDIVLLKWIGLEGVLRIKRESKEELKKRFIPAFINKVEAEKKELFSVTALETAAATGVSAMHQIGDGGIFAALWELAESAGVGLSVDLRKMAVKQETIEVCEYFHLNPYQLTSTGAVLLVTDRGEELADALNHNKMPAVVIGHTTAEKERVIMNGGEKRYLDRPAQDEFARIFAIWNSKNIK